MQDYYNHNPSQYTALQDHKGGSLNNIIAATNETSQQKNGHTDTGNSSTEKPNQHLNKFFSSTSRKTISRDFPKENFTQAINLLVYGAKIIKLSHRRKKRHERFFYIHEDEDAFLQWLSPKKKYLSSRLDLRKVNNISEETKWKLPHNIRNKLLLCIETSSKKNVLVLEFPSVEQRLIWWQGIAFFCERAINRERSSDQTKNIAADLFNNADEDGNKQLDLVETKELFKKMHLNVDSIYIEKLFRKYDRNGSNTIDQDEFHQIIKSLMFKAELVDYFFKYTSELANLPDDCEKPVMSIENIQSFFHEIQGVDYTNQEINEIIMKFHEGAGEKISFLTFSNLIFSEHNEISDPAKTCIYQDMSRPLTDYYIISSHNTYLTSHQLVGESSTQAYRDALMRGCRCVELDCWDGDEGEPIIYHGHTLTSKITFSDVISTVKNFGFVRSKYPVILSLEVHCSVNQQDRMGELLQEILGDKLYLLPFNYESIVNYPSPEDLIEKVIVKGKSIPEKTWALLHSEDYSKSRRNTEDLEENEKDFPNKIITHQFISSPNMANTEDLFEGNTIANGVSDGNLINPVNTTTTKRSNFHIENSVIQFTDEKPAAGSNIGTAPKLIRFDSYEEEEKRGYEYSKSNYDNNLHDYFTNLRTMYYEQQTTKNLNGGTSEIKMQSEPNIIDFYGNTNNKSELKATNDEDILIPCDDGEVEERKRTEENDIPEEEKNLSDQYLRNERKDDKGRDFSANRGLLVQVDNNKANSNEKKKKGDHKASNGLQKCITMFSVKIDLKKESKKRLWSVCSINENKINKFIKENEAGIIEYNRTAFTRVYPAGHRVDSSNYDPMNSFISGSQIIALNFQTIDHPLTLYHSKFIENGGEECGYLLKPEYMRYDYAGNIKSTKDLKSFQKTISLTMVSAQQLRSHEDKFEKDIVDPYVEISIRGIADDENLNTGSFKTEFVKDNGFNPIFKSNIFTFRFKAPELAIMTFTVWDKDTVSDQKLGSYSIPVNCMRSGLRIIPLYDSRYVLREYSRVLARVNIYDEDNN